MHRSYLQFLLPMVTLFVGRIHSEGIADVSFQRVQQTIGFDVFKSDLRITKFNRTCAVMNGTIDLLVDMDNRFSLQIKSAHSRLGNNQFNEYPYKIAENPFCHVMNETYREYEDLFEKTTNLPHVGADVTCPVPAGNYWFKHFTFKPETMPQMIPEGYWRLTVLLTAEDGRKADLQIFLKVSKESYW
ncbi:uncharacterized protein LOC134212449 [Armigeres subalbatus]|uniref:uncharacterized protein LOC134212449 n=1 Tax=Armigeres subalbatus TaxID=124917 RepID=UPI002ED68D32